MKKIFNYFIFKISSLKILVVFLLTAIYQFGFFVRLINRNIQFNFYDLLMDSFGYLPLFFSISLLYLIAIYNICEKTTFYKYIFLKFESKYHVYNANVLVVLTLSILLVLFINVISIIECFGNISFKNTWSPYFFYTTSGRIVNVFYTNESIKIITNKLSPLTYIIFNNIFVILYLFFLGIVFLVSHLYLKKRALSFIMVLIINIASMCLDSVSNITNFTFTNNIYLLNASTKELNNNFFIISRLSYWLILIAITFFIGKILIKKNDFSLEE